MWDSILKYLSNIVSVKTAIKWGVFVLIVTACWQELNYLFALRDIPIEYAHILTFLASSALSYLLVEIAYRLGNFVGNKHTERKEKREQKRIKDHEAKVLNNRFNATLQHFDGAQLNILKKLLREESVYSWRNEKISNFQNSNFIQPIAKLNSRELVYRLNPQIRDSLLNYLSQVRQTVIESTSRSLEENEYQLLRVFFEEIVPFGVDEDEKWMPAQVYSTRFKLINSELIVSDESDDTDTLKITSDFKERLILDGHFDRCYREEVSLRRDLIEAPTAYRVSHAPFP